MITTLRGETEFFYSLQKIHVHWEGGFFVGSAKPFPSSALQDEVAQLPTVVDALYAHMYLRHHFQKFGVYEPAYCSQWLDKILKSQPKQCILEPRRSPLSSPMRFDQQPFGATFDCLCFDLVALIVTGANLANHQDQWVDRFRRHRSCPGSTDRLVALLTVLQRCPTNPQRCLASLVQSFGDFAVTALRVSPTVWLPPLLLSPSYDAFDVLDAVVSADNLPLPEEPSWMITNFAVIMTIINSAVSRRPVSSEAALRRIAGSLARVLLANADGVRSLQLITSVAGGSLDSCVHADVVGTVETWLESERDNATTPHRWVQMFVAMTYPPSAIDALRGRLVPPFLRAHIPALLHCYIAQSGAATSANLETLGVIIASMGHDVIQPFVDVGTEKAWLLTAPQPHDASTTRVATLAVQLATRPPFMNVMCNDAYRFMQWLSSSAEYRQQLLASIELAFQRIMIDIGTCSASYKLLCLMQTSQNLTSLLRWGGDRFSSTLEAFENYRSSCEREILRLRADELVVQWIARKVPSAANLLSPPVVIAAGTIDTLAELRCVPSSLMSLPDADDDMLKLLPLLIGRERPSTLFELFFDQQVKKHHKRELPSGLDSLCAFLRGACRDIIDGDNVPPPEAIASRGLFTPEFHSDLQLLGNECGATSLRDQLGDLGLLFGLSSIARIVSQGSCATSTMTEAKDLAQRDLAAGLEWLAQHDRPALAAQWKRCEPYVKLINTIQACPKPLGMDSDSLVTRESEDNTMKFVLDCWRRIAPLKSALCQAASFEDAAIAFERYASDSVSSDWVRCDADIDSLRQLAAESEDTASYVMDVNGLTRLITPVRYLHLSYLPVDLASGYVRCRRRVTTKGPSGEDRLSFDHDKILDLIQQVRTTSSIQETELALQLLDGWDALSAVEATVDEMIAAGFPIPPTNWTLSIELFPDRRWPLQRLRRKVQVLRDALGEWKAAVLCALEGNPSLHTLSWARIGKACLMPDNITLDNYSGDRSHWHARLTTLIVDPLGYTPPLPAPAEIDVIHFDNTQADSARVVSHVVGELTRAMEHAGVQNIDFGTLLVDATTKPPELEWISSRAKCWRGVYVLVVFAAVYQSPIITHVIRELDRLQEAQAGRFLVFMEKGPAESFPTAIKTVAHEVPLTALARCLSTLPASFLSFKGPRMVIASNGPASGKSEHGRRQSDHRVALLDDFSAIHQLADVDTSSSSTRIWFDVSQFMLQPLPPSDRMGVANELANGPVALGMRLFVLFRDCKLHCGATTCVLHPQSTILVEQPSMSAGVSARCEVLPLFSCFVDNPQHHQLIDCTNLDQAFSLDRTDKNIHLIRGAVLVHYLDKLTKGRCEVDEVAALTSRSTIAMELPADFAESNVLGFLRDTFRVFNLPMAVPVLQNFLRTRVFLVALAGLMWRGVHAAMKARKDYLAFADLCIKQAAFVSCPMRSAENLGCEVSLQALADWKLQGLFVPALDRHPNMFFWNTKFYSSESAARRESAALDSGLFLEQLVDASPKFNAMTYLTSGVTSSTEHAVKLLRYVVGCRGDQHELLQKYIDGVAVTPTVFLRLMVFSAWTNASVPLVMVGAPAEGKTFLSDRIAAFKSEILHDQIEQRYWKAEIGAQLAETLCIDGSRRGLLTSGNKAAIMQCAEAVVQHCEGNSATTQLFFASVLEQLRVGFPVVVLEDNPSTWESMSAMDYAVAALERLCSLRLQFKPCKHKVVLHPSKLSIAGVEAAISDFAAAARHYNIAELRLVKDAARVRLADHIPIAFDLTLDEWTTASQLGLLADRVSKAASLQTPNCRSWHPLRLTLITNPHSVMAAQQSSCPVHPMPFTAAALAMHVSNLPEGESQEYQELLLRSQGLHRTTGSDLAADVVSIIIRSCALMLPYATTTQRDVIFVADALAACKTLCHATRRDITTPSVMRHAVALVVDVVFASRITKSTDRSRYMETVSASDEWHRLCSRSCDAIQPVAVASDECSRWFVNHETFEVPKNIVLEAMRRYLTAMLISVVSQPPIPLAIVDEPGTGKTEAARILESNMSGLSRRDFFARLVQLRDIVIHGRADATSESIERGFLAAENELAKLKQFESDQRGNTATRSDEKEDCSSWTVVRVLYDEANLASQSLTNKALHRPFDERRVAVVCLLNALFDAPNMSRCVNIVNASAHEDIITGHFRVLDCVEASSMRGASITVDARIEASITAGCRDLLMRPSCFFHRRDLTFFLRCLQAEGALDAEKIIKAAAMNFDGDDSWETTDGDASPQLCAVRAIMYEHKASAPGRDVSQEITSRSLPSMYNILTADRTLKLSDTGYTASYRFLMLIDRTHDYSDVECMLQSPDVRIRDALNSYDRCFFSTFTEDQRPEGLSTSVAQFRAFFTEGRRVVAQNWVMHCTPFFAALNRQLSIHPGTSNPVCIFPLPSGTKKGEVKRDTLLIVIVKSADVRWMLPQIRSRFEAHFAEVSVDRDVLSELQSAWGAASAVHSSDIVRSASLRSAAMTNLHGATDASVHVGIMRLTGLSFSKLERAALLLSQGSSHSQFWYMSERLSDAGVDKEKIREVYYRQQPASLDDIFSMDDAALLVKPWMIFTSDHKGCQALDREALKWQPCELRYDQRPRFVDAGQFTSQQAFQQTVSNEVDSSKSPLIILISDLHAAEHINFVRFLVSKLYRDALLRKSCTPFCIGVLIRIQCGNYPLVFSPAWNVVHLPVLLPTQIERLAVCLLRRAYDAALTDVETDYMRCCATLLLEKRDARPPSVINAWQEVLPAEFVIDRADGAAGFYTNEGSRVASLIKVLSAHHHLKAMLQIPSSGDVRTFWEASWSSKGPIYGLPCLSAKLTAEGETSWVRRSIGILQNACYGYGLISLERATKYGALLEVTALVALPRAPIAVWRSVPLCPYNPWVLDFIDEEVRGNRPHQLTWNSLEQHFLDGSGSSFDELMLKKFTEDIAHHPSTAPWVASQQASTVLDALTKALELLYDENVLGECFCTPLRLAVAAVYATRVSEEASPYRKKRCPPRLCCQDDNIVVPGAPAMGMCNIRSLRVPQENAVDLAFLARNRLAPKLCKLLRGDSGVPGPTVDAVLFVAACLNRTPFVASAMGEGASPQPVFNRGPAPPGQGAAVPYLAARCLDIVVACLQGLLPHENARMPTSVDDALRHVYDECFVVRCPGCRTPLSGFDGCFAVGCICGERYCSWCLERITDEPQHVPSCGVNPHRGVAYGTVEQWSVALNRHRAQALREYLRQHDPAAQRLMLGALTPDLYGYGIPVEDFGFLPKVYPPTYLHLLNEVLSSLSEHLLGSPARVEEAVWWWCAKLTCSGPITSWEDATQCFQRTEDPLEWMATLKASSAGSMQCSGVLAVLLLGSVPLVDE